MKQWTTAEVRAVDDESNLARWYSAAAVARLEARVQTLTAALTRLRDCDWVVTPIDRMDAVRDIARQALADAGEEVSQ